MNLPNYIILGRIVVVPLLVVVLLTPAGETWFGFSGYTLAIVIFLIAALTDIVDGQLARRRNQVSTLDKFLDPIADKLLISQRRGQPAEHFSGITYRALTVR